MSQKQTQTQMPGVQSKVMFGYAMALLAMLMWAGVAYFATYIQGERAAYVHDIQSVSEKGQQAATDARLHVIATSNAENAVLLDQILSPDVPTMIAAIKSIGVTANVPIEISEAAPGSVPKNQKDIHAVTFVIESQGSFSSMMQVLSLFESIPLASSVEFVSLTYGDAKSSSAAGAASSWQLNVKLRVITTASVT